MSHPYHAHREYQASHRRVGTRLKGEPEGATKHATGKAFSNVTSKTAAAAHDSKVEGRSSPKRYARGGKVKGATTNIAIVLPGGKGEAPDMPMPPMAGGPPPMPGPGLPPGAPPPGLPMRASGGRVKKAGGGGIPQTGRQMDEDARKTREILERRGIVTPAKASGGSVGGESTKGNIAKMAARADKNSFFRGGAATGVGREEKAARMKRKGK